MFDARTRVCPLLLEGGSSQAGCSQVRRTEPNTWLHLSFQAEGWEEAEELPVFSQPWGQTCSRSLILQMPYGKYDKEGTVSKGILQQRDRLP